MSIKVLNPTNCLPRFVHFSGCISNVCFVLFFVLKAKVSHRESKLVCGINISKNISLKEADVLADDTVTPRSPYLSVISDPPDVGDRSHLARPQNSRQVHFLVPHHHKRSWEMDVLQLTCLSTRIHQSKGDALRYSIQRREKIELATEIKEKCPEFSLALGPMVAICVLFFICSLQSLQWLHLYCWHMGWTDCWGQRRSPINMSALLHLSRPENVKLVSPVTYAAAAASVGRVTMK